MLVVLVMDQHKVRIEVSRGLEDRISDRFAKEVIDRVMIPEFRHGQYATGIEKGVDHLIKHLQLIVTILSASTFSV